MNKVVDKLFELLALHACDCDLLYGYVCIYHHPSSVAVDGIKETIREIIEGVEMDKF